MMTELSWQVNKEVSRDMTGEADGMNQGVDSRDGVMSDLWIVIFNEEMVGGRRKGEKGITEFLRYDGNQALVPT